LLVSSDRGLEQSQAHIFVLTTDYKLLILLIFKNGIDTYYCPKKTSDAYAGEEWKKMVSIP